MRQRNCFDGQVCDGTSVEVDTDDLNDDNFRGEFQVRRF